MNCFEWGVHIVEDLDQSLEPAIEKDFRNHEKACFFCRERKSRQTKIYETLRKLPGSVWQSAENFSENKTEFISHSSEALTLKRRWETIPWYFKILIESLGVITFSFLIVRSGQWVIRSRDNKIDHQIEQIDFSPEIKATQGQPPGLATSAKLQTQDDSAVPQDDYAEDDEGDTSVEVGRSEVWRFYIKTDTPSELRNQVIATLKEIRIFDGTPGTAGIEAPGGIQFSFNLKQTDVNSLKLSLEKLAPKPIQASQNQAESSLSQPFTWYKKKSREPVPAGQSHIIIWLSQL